MHLTILCIMVVSAIVHYSNRVRKHIMRTTQLNKVVQTATVTDAGHTYIIRYLPENRVHAQARAMLMAQRCKAIHVGSDLADIIEANKVEK